MFIHSRQRAAAVRCARRHRHTYRRPAHALPAPRTHIYIIYHDERAQLHGLHHAFRRMLDRPQAPYAAPPMPQAHRGRAALLPRYYTCRNIAANYFAMILNILDIIQPPYVDIF